MQNKHELDEGAQQQSKRPRVATDIVEYNKDDDTYALVDAAQSGKLEQVRALIAGTPEEEKGLALIAAAGNGHLPVVQFLIQNHVDIETRSNTGPDETALLTAGRNNQSGVVQLLMESKADARARDSESNTVFLLAATNGNLPLMKYLLFQMLSSGIHIKDIYVSGYLGATALLNAAESGHLAIVEWLMSAVLDGEFDDAKSDAEYKGEDFSGGFSALEVDHLGRNVFLLAAEKNRINVMTFLYDSYEETFKRLEGCDNEGRTALLLAAFYTSVDAVNFLCSEGAKIDHVDFEGNNAFHLAAKNGSIDILKILLRYLRQSVPDIIFAVLNTPNSLGFTARDAILQLPEGESLLHDFSCSLLLPHHPRSSLSSSSDVIRGGPTTASFSSSSSSSSSSYASVYSPFLFRSSPALPYYQDQQNSSLPCSSVP